MRPVARASLTIRASPAHDTTVSARPSQPGHESSAPNATNTAVITICQKMIHNASSVVSHAVKKVAAINHAGRCGGRMATAVHARPTIAKTRYQVALVTEPR